jgi:hypothetical protein
MKITKQQLKRIIKEEKRKLLKEQSVPDSLVEALSDAMTAILDHLENNAELRLDPEDVPLQALEIIEGAVEGFKEYLGSGYNADDGGTWDEADQDYANQAYAEEHGDPYNEGTSLDNMPNSWRQVLGTCLKDRK